MESLKGASQNVEPLRDRAWIIEKHDGGVKSFATTGGDI